MTTTTQTETPARFTLDEGKARALIAELIERDEISDGYDPQDDEYGHATDTLMSYVHREVITGPGQIVYDHCEGSDEIGYVWLVYVDGPGALKLATTYSKIKWLGGGEGTEPGADQALAVLGQAVFEANALLDDLAGYVAALPLAVRAPEITEVWAVHISDRYGDGISVHATSDLAYQAATEYAREGWADLARKIGSEIPESCDDLPDDEIRALYFEHNSEASWSVDASPVLTS